MACDQPCPAPRSFALYLGGLLDETAASALEEHLLGCPKCVERMADAAEGDPLSGLMRGNGPALAADWLDRIDVDAVQDRCKRLFAGAITTRLVGPDDDCTRGAAGTTDAPLPRIAGHEVLGVLGRGGMGVVYLARQQQANRLVAIKMVLAGPYAAPEQRARFRTEIELSARLRHPHIVQVYEVGEVDECPYYSMEYLDGGSLAQLLQGTPVAARVAAQVVAALAGAMAHAHRHRVIHRDLKPANVLLECRGEGEGFALRSGAGRHEVKIGDFGLAKRLDASVGQTHAGAIIGTPSYMAPEQAEGLTAQLGPAVDVYALGTILYELLTGRAPFRAATSVETLRQVVHDEPVPPSRLQSSVPRDLEVICLTCLHKDAAKRYAAADQLQDDLRRFLNGEPIRARTPGMLERGLKWMRRRPLIAGLLSACVLILGILAIVGVQLALTVDQLAQERDRVQAREADVRQRLYAADLRLGAELWSSGDVTAAAALLERQRALAGTEFTWHFYNAQVGNTAAGHVGEMGAAVQCSAFAPDGRHAAAGARDGTLLLLDVQTRTTRSWAAHVGAVTQVVLLAKSLVTVGADRAMRWWDLSGRLVGTVQRSPAVQAIWLSSDAQQALELAKEDRASAGREHRFTIWDTATELPRGTFLTSANTTQAVFSPDGQSLATWGPRDLVVQLWQADTGAPCGDVWTSSPIALALFEPQRSYLIGALRDGTVFIRPTGLRKEWQALPLDPGHAPKTGLPLGCLALGPDGVTLYGGTINAVIAQWHLREPRSPVHWRGHRSMPTTLALSADGARMLSGAEDGSVRLWDLTQPGEAQPVRVPVRPAGPIAFANEAMALADRDYSIHLLSLPAGQPRLRLHGHAVPTLDLAITADQKYLASIGGDHKLRVWDLAAGRLLCMLPQTDLPVSVRTSRDGRWLALGLAGGAIALWRLDQLAQGVVEPAHTLEHGGVLAQLAFSPDSSTLFSASRDVVRCWHVDSAVEKAPPFVVEHPRGLGFSRTGKLRLVGGPPPGDAVVTEHGRTEPLGSLPIPVATVRAAAFSPSDDVVALARGRDIQVFDLKFRSVAVMQHGCHQDDVVAIAYSLDGRHLASVSRDGLCQLWDTRSWRAVRPERQVSGPVRALAFADHDRKLVAASATPVGIVERAHTLPFGVSTKTRQDNLWQDRVQVWDVGTGDELPPLATTRHTGVTSLAVVADQTVLAGTVGGRILRWNLDTSHELPSYFISPAALAYWHAIEVGSAVSPISPLWRENVSALALSGDGRLAIQDDTGRLVVMDALTGALRRLTAKDAAGRSALSFTPDGSHLVTARGKQLEFWDAERESAAPAQQRDTPHKHDIACLAYSANGRLLATGACDRSIVVHDARGAVVHTLVGHTDTVTCVTFSPDGRTLASGSLDGQLRLWDVLTGQPLAWLRAHSGPVHCLQFSTKGNVLASGGATSNGAGEIFLWKAGY